MYDLGGYFGDILGISFGYLGDILGISRGYFGDILGISLGYLRNILSERTSGVPPVIFLLPNVFGRYTSAYLFLHRGF